MDYVQHMKSQPMIAVTDVEASSRWYQRVLGATSGHGGTEYEQLLVDGEMVLQLHLSVVDHHHSRIGDPAHPFGNGVALWFYTETLDDAVARIGSKEIIVADLHFNPNAGQREIWIRDPDGYLVVLSGPS